MNILIITGFGPHTINVSVPMWIPITWLVCVLIVAIDKVAREHSK